MIQSYLSPSEVKELRAICSDLETVPLSDNEQEAFDAEERNYASRDGYALACRFQHDTESFEEGQPLFGLHPSHAGHVASLNRQPLGWSW